MISDRPGRASPETGLETGPETGPETDPPATASPGTDLLRPASPKDALPDGQRHTNPWIGDGDLDIWLNQNLTPTTDNARPPPCWLNARQAERVRQAHRAFRQAGAALLRTNTNGADPLTLARWQLEERCEALNTSGAALLRESLAAAPSSSSSEGWRLGTVAALPASIDTEAQERAYSAQLIYLADTGIDAFLPLGFRHLDPLCRLLRLSQRVAQAPLLALLHFDAQGRSAEGYSARQVAQRLHEEGAQAIGWSGSWPHHPEALQAFAEETRLPLALYPDLPPQATPESFGSRLLLLGRDAGALILGGGKGVLPTHIAALQKAVRQASSST